IVDFVVVAQRDHRLVRVFLVHLHAQRALLQLRGRLRFFGRNLVLRADRACEYSDCEYCEPDHDMANHGSSCLCHFSAASTTGRPSHAPGNAPAGAAGGVRNRLTPTTSTPTTVPIERTYFTPSATAVGTTNCHTHTPTRSTQLIGRKYFRHVIIT